MAPQNGIRSGMDIAALSNATQRPPTTIEVRPAPSDRAPSTGTDGATADAKSERSFWQQAFGDDGFSFGTLLDIVNPLQHIPIVSTIYQKLTGDEASPAANVIGGALFGGPIGLMVAAADSALKIETGKDTGGHVFALFDSATPAETAVADASKPTTPSGADTQEQQKTQPAAPETTQAETAAAITPAQVLADAPKAAKPNPATVHATNEVPRSAFVIANSTRHAPGHGVGGAFVPFETRSTIAPPSFYAPVSFGFATPADSADTKRTDKTASPAIPDLKTLAGNPDQMKKLRINGMRPTPTTKPVPLESRALPGAAQMPSAMDGTAPTPSTSGALSAGNTGDGFADLMARNIERYLSLKNARPAPSRVNQSF
jgi:hypothetical protein